MKRCAFLTLENPAGFFIYDELAREPLASLGWSLDTIPWTSQDTDWARFDLVIIRSTWDYQQKATAFLNALESIEQSGARLENPLSIVRWNLEKTYLRDLERKGIQIVPTRWQRGFCQEDIDDLCRAHDAEEAIVKPTIGANADDTFRLPSRGSNEQTKKALSVFQERPVMLQPFLQEIVATGEYSLFFFGGQYSHCVLKTAKAGDFRVQEEHGGQITAVTPAADLLKAGQQVIDAVGATLLYARADLVRLSDGQPALMELELIEPSLYFSHAPEAAKRFARVIDSWNSPLAP